MKNEDLIIRKKWVLFLCSSLLQEFIVCYKCAEFKVGRFSRFRSGVRLSVLQLEIFLQRNTSNPEKYNIKHPLNTFSGQMFRYSLHFLPLSHTKEERNVVESVLVNLSHNHTEVTQNFAQKHYFD